MKYQTYKHSAKHIIIIENKHKIKNILFFSKLSLLFLKKYDVKIQKHIKIELIENPAFIKNIKTSFTFTNPSYYNNFNIKTLKLKLKNNKNKKRLSKSFF